MLNRAILQHTPPLARIARSVPDNGSSPDDPPSLILRRAKTKYFTQQFLFPSVMHI